MSSLPKISICLDVFNYARFLPRAIESVLGQTHADFELLIQDDRSTDDSFAIALEFAARDSRISAVQNSANLGMVRNRNAALARARGDYVKFLHADDFLNTPEAIARMLAPFEANRALVFVACAAQNVDEAGAPVSVARHRHSNRVISGTSVITRCLREQRNLVGGPSSVMLRRTAALRGFDESYFHAADLEMWFHVLEQGAFLWIDEPLCAYRWHPSQQTEKDKSTLSAARDLARIVETYLPRPYVDLPKWMRRYLRDSAERELWDQSHRLNAPAEGRPHPLVPAARFAVRQARFVERHVLPRLRRRAPDFAPGINVVGFLAGEYGIGSSSRAYAGAARLTGAPCAFLNVRSKVHSNRDASLGEFARDNRYRTNLMTFSADYARRFRRDMGRRFFAGHKNVAVWYWEVEKFPAKWHAEFDLHDEIWVATRFCEESLAAVAPVPVHRIPYPFTGGTAVPDRKKFGIPEDAFTFLFNFDFMSVVERKNPYALIEAFGRAFRRDDKALLVLKTINSGKPGSGAAEFREAIRDLNVLWIEPHLPGADVETLFATCDSFASLHRSEGLGLGLIQAMWYGKPVIGTGWSGNLDFMKRENSMLVRYDLRELDRDYGPYLRGNRWAEADVAHAAELMRWTFENRDEAAALGRRAANDIREMLNPGRAAVAIRERLQAIGGI